MHVICKIQALPEFKPMRLFLRSFLFIAILAVWRHGSSKRASEAAEKFQHVAQQFAAQKDLLQLVTDSQPTSIFILDTQNRYRFANAQASSGAGITPAEPPVGAVITR